MNRLIAWTAFLVGIGASTAANVAHARDGWGPRLVAAMAPVALVLAVELATRLAWRTGWRWWLARWVGTGVIGAVTAVVSYRHQAGLFGAYGEDWLNRAILPLSIDGLMLVAAAALLSLSDKATRGDSVEVVAPLSPPVAAGERHVGDASGDMLLSPMDVADVAATLADVSPGVAWLSPDRGDMWSDTYTFEATASDMTVADAGDMSDVDVLSQRRADRAAARKRQRDAAKQRQQGDSDDTGDSEATGE